MDVFKATGYGIHQRTVSLPFNIRFIHNEFNWQRFKNGEKNPWGGDNNDKVRSAYDIAYPSISWKLSPHNYKIALIYGAG